MAKVQIKSEKITPFGGIFHVRDQFPRFVVPVIDKVLVLRCTSYDYSVINSLFSHPNKLAILSIVGSVG